MTVSTIEQRRETIQSAELPKARAELVSDGFRLAIPRDFAREHLVLSQGRGEDGREVLAVAESSSEAAVFNTGVHLGMAIKPVLHESESIARALDEAYGAASPDAGDAGLSAFTSGEADDVDALLAAADRDLLSTQGKGPIVKLVDALLFEALTRGASDVHVQPLADRTLVRYRLDGVLHTHRELVGAREMTAAIVSRIKVMGRMDIAERRLPQDGRAAVTIGERAIDLRISTLPTSYGERAVIRLLDNSNHLCDFESLGMPPEVAQKYLERARRAHGMILLTGPTGSGKTTTLYATLRTIATSDDGSQNSEVRGPGSPVDTRKSSIRTEGPSSALRPQTSGLNIMTIEDPIEYELATAGLAISQAQVNTRKGVTFASGLRHILRQDPDVVMVGEIRDAETARIAIQSSLTGHLVFSTLHTNDAPSAVTRLVDLGIEPYLVGASLSAVLAQRLVRTVHPACAGEGCEVCLGTGYRGRTGLFELMVIDETIAEMISRSASAAELRSASRANGLRTLAEDGQRLVALARTTPEEVRRVVQGAWSPEGNSGETGDAHGGSA